MAVELHQYPLRNERKNVRLELIARKNSANEHEVVPSSQAILDAVTEPVDDRILEKESCESHEK